MTPPAAARGFTLVEMLVALLIFAVLAGAGVGLLRASVDTQEAVNGALADLSAAARLRVLLGNDLAQALARPLPQAPAGFRGDGQGLTMVRAGERGLQPLRWELSGTTLVRRELTSRGESAGPSAILAREVTSLAFRYREAGGAWQGAWSPPATAAPLPAAVELTLGKRGQAPVTLLVALPEGPAPPRMSQAPGA